MFALWRNLYFANATQAAADRNVRYAGMGDNHREWLKNNRRMPTGAHVYVFTETGLAASIERTRQLRES
jgi:hypothetical protein